MHLISHDVHKYFRLVGVQVCDCEFGDIVYLPSFPRQVLMVL